MLRGRELPLLLLGLLAGFGIARTTSLNATFGELASAFSTIVGAWWIARAFHRQVQAERLRFAHIESCCDRTASLVRDSLRAATDPERRKLLRELSNEVLWLGQGAQRICELRPQTQALQRALFEFKSSLTGQKVPDASAPRRRPGEVLLALVDMRRVVYEAIEDSELRR